MYMGQTLIDKASETCGGLRRLADRIGEDPGFLSKIRTGKKLMSPGIAGHLAELIGEDPRNAACAALILAEKDEAKRADLARMFGIDATNLNTPALPRNL